MHSQQSRPHQGPGLWRWATFGLLVLLVLSWGLLGYALLDSAISLDYCRVAQRGLQDDVALLVDAGHGVIGRDDVLAARAARWPELGDKVQPDGSILLSRGALQFGEDGALLAIGDQFE
jgi:hypothetical protein